MAATRSGQDPREREIFEEALDHEEPAARARFLDQACAGEPALRSRIDGLLRSVGSDPGFLPERSAAAEPAEPGGPGFEGPGDAIGRYHLLERIGEGGCGVVYMAEQREPVRRRVALKILKPGMDTRSVVARFEAERQALALMEHPNIARVFDGGATPAGRPYFVMELVRGVRITEFCDAQRLTTTERLSLFLQVCAAIQHAHQKGIIHRDIKPSNILVTVNDGVPTPKVIDFGIAKATGQQLTDKTLFTQFHALIGTPAYMSPEQAEMSSLDVDTRTDVYSLGVLLYELLTGRPPFDTAELLSVGIDVLRRRLREQEPVRPSTRLRTLSAAELTTTAGLRRRLDGPRLVSELQGDLDWIVLKCLEKDRARRYDSTGALAEDIRRHLEDEPVVARPPSMSYRLRKTMVRHRLAVTAGLLVAGTLVVATSVSLRMLVLETAARGRAESESQRANSAAAAARSAELEARRSAYAADMRAAQSALSVDELGRVRTLLAAHEPRPDMEDLRGPEWHWLREASRDESASVIPHPGIVAQIRMSPAGDRFATLCLDGTARLWDARSGTLQVEIPDAGHLAAAFSPDGRRIAVWGGGDTGIWAVADGRHVQSIPGLGGPLLFSRTGPWIFGLRSGRLVRHDPGTGAEEALPDVLPGGAPTVLAPVGPDQFADCARISGTPIALCDGSNGRLIRHLHGLDEPVAVRGSSDGRWVAAGDALGQVALWEAGTGRQVARWQAHSIWALGLAFSSDGSLLATGGGDQRVRLWRVDSIAGDSPRPESEFQGHEGEVWSVAFLDAPRRWISGGKDATVRMWDHRAGRRAPAPRIALPPGHPFGLDATAGAVVSTLSDGTMTWTAFAGGQTVRQQQLPVPVPGAPLWLGDGRVVAVDARGDVVDWDTREGRERWRRSLGEGWLRPVGSSDGGGRILLTGWDPTRRCLVLDGATGAEVVRFPDYSGVDAAFGQTAAISRDGRRVAYAGPGYSVIVEEIDGKPPRRVLGGLTWNVYSVAISPDGDRVAATGWDGRLGIWDARTGVAVTAPAPAHSSGIHRVEFTAAGKTAMTVGEDGMLRLWNAVNGRLMLEFPRSYPFEGTMVDPAGRGMVRGVNDNGAWLEWMAFPED